MIGYQRRIPPGPLELENGKGQDLQEGKEKNREKIEVQNWKRHACRKLILIQAKVQGNERMKLIIDDDELVTNRVETASRRDDRLAKANSTRSLLWSKSWPIMAIFLDLE